ncbi:MAG: glycosyltransferase [Clostridia bacterium]|nr:glycosyltransferase [Clostridia bacterium]
MKVLQINSVCGIGSTGRICTGIAEILEKNGHECLIAYGRESVPERYKKYAHKIGNEFNVKLAALSARIFDNEGFSNKRATLRLIEKIKQYAPDIVHLHNLHGYYINIEILFDYLKSANIPVVSTLHDCWTMTGHCAYFDSIECKKWCEEGCSDCPLKTDYPKSIVLDNSKRNFAKKKKIFTKLFNLTFVTPSLWLSEIAKKSFLGKYRVETIYNGIDLETFKPTKGSIREKYGIGSKKIILGVANVWDKRKGLPDLIKLAELMGEEYRVVVVGLSPKQRDALPQNIIGLTRTNSTKELAELYSEACVYFNPTYEDNFPSANQEALACGTPVVTYPTGGSPEAIDAKSGVVTKERSPESAVEAIKIAESLRREDCIARAKQFDINEKYCEYLKLYEEILAKA